VAHRVETAIGQFFDSIVGAQVDAEARFAQTYAGRLAEVSDLAAAGEVDRAANLLDAVDLDLQRLRRARLLRFGEQLFG